MKRSMSKLANRANKTPSGQYFEKETFSLEVFSSEHSRRARFMNIYYTCYAKHFEISLAL